LAGTASAGVQAGEFYDTATIAGGDNPAGTVTFKVFGPDDANCARPPVQYLGEPGDRHRQLPDRHLGPLRPHPAGTYTSGPFTPTAPGVYHWVAGYSGHANSPSAATPCDDPLQRVVVDPAPRPSTTTTQSTSTTVPGRCAEVGRARLGEQLDGLSRALGGIGDPWVAAMLDQVRTQVDARLARALAGCRPPQAREARGRSP
jgi:hypothetical protein